MLTDLPLRYVCKIEIKCRQPTKAEHNQKHNWHQSKGLTMIQLKQRINKYEDTCMNDKRDRLHCRVWVGEE